MKALVLEEYNRLVYRDFPEPEPGPGEVLVRVKACGICGSDVHGMDGSTGRRIPPVIMGHEASGIIEKTGEEVKGWSRGDRVTFDSTIYRLNDWYTRKGMYNLSDHRRVLGVSTPEYRQHGAFAEWVAVPQHILYRIPDNVSFTQAAMVEPIAVSLHAINLTPLLLGDSAVVIGSGMIGFFLIQLLRLKGCNPVIAVDIDEEKLQMAQKAGAHVTLDPGKETISGKILGLTHQRGADLAFEVVGKSETLAAAVDSVRKGGTVTVIGNLSPKAELPLQSLVTRQLRLQGSCAINGEFEQVLELLSHGLIDTGTLLSAEAPLAEGAAWFDRLYNREKGLNKVVLIP